jgi:hypothetical protein
MERNFVRKMCSVEMYGIQHVVWRKRAINGGNTINRVKMNY